MTSLANKSSRRRQVNGTTAVSYGLIVALIIGAAIMVFGATGVDIKSIFSSTGNAISATMGPQPIQIGPPNQNLSAEQQSEIANAAA